MPFPLGTVLSTAPTIISAAAELIRVIRERKGAGKPEADKLAELEGLIERQALIIEELAQNNNMLGLAVRNNRIVAALAVVLALGALALAVWR